MRMVIIFLFLLWATGPLIAQSVRIDHPEFGKVYTKAQKEPSFTRTNGDVNLQKYFSDYFQDNKLIPPGFNAMVILTLIVSKSGEAFFSKAFSADPSIDLAPLKLQRCIDLMNTWFPGYDLGEEVHFQVMLTLKFENNSVSVRRMSF